MTDALAEMAERLEAARIDRRPVAPLTESRPDLSLSDAYAIQQINLQARTNGGSARLIGYKIGVTSRAVQQWLNVDQPDFGGLLDSMVVAEGDAVDIDTLLQPRIEGEVAFVLARELRGPGVTPADVVSATEYVVPALEIIDSRIQDWKIKIQDTVADNASSALFVIGSQPVRLEHIDLRLCGMALRCNGELVSSGAGAACMGHPVNAVAWLANTLGRLQTSLPAGSVILSGALGPVHPCKGGHAYELQVGGLGTIRVRFEGAASI